MNNPSHALMSPRTKIIATLGLVLLAVAGNYLSVPLFFSVSFIFGSIAVMLAVTLLGTVPAVVVAIAGGLYTLASWGHPYALVIFTAEALVVGLLYQRGLRNLVLADLAYWLVLGAPLVLLFYRGAIGMEWEAAVLIALKQPINGLFNALLAGLIILGLQLSWRGAQRMGLGAVRLGSLLFHVLLTTILFAGAVPVIQEGYSQRVQQEAFMAERLAQSARHLAARLTAEPGADSVRWQAHLAAEQENAGTGLALLAADGRVLASQGEVASLLSERPGLLQPLEGGLAIWLPAGDMPAMPRWKQGRYQFSMPVAGVEGVAAVVIEQTAAPLVRTLERRGLDMFTFLAGLLVLGILVARLLSHWLIRPLSELDRTSRDMSTLIASGKPPVLPDSPIQEYDGLGRSLREMSSLLAGRFRELRDFNAALFGAAGAIMAVIDRNGHIVRFNRAAEAATGFSAEEIAGKPFWEFLLPPEEHASVMSVFENLKSGSIVPRYENHWLMRDGTRRLYDWSNAVLLDARGEVEFIVTIGVDITGGKHAQQALQQFKNTLDQTLDCVFMFDAEDMRFFYVNEGALKQVGYSEDELLTMHSYDIKPEMSETQFREMVAPLLAGEQTSLTFETVHQHKQGQRLPVEIFLQYLAPEGEPARFVAIVRDISERKAAEQALRENEQRFRDIAQQLTLATEVAQLGVWDMNLINGRLDWDAGMFRIYGMAEQDFGHTVEDWACTLLPETRERATADFEQGVAHPESPYESEFMIRRSDGRIRHIRAMAQAIPGPEGRVERVIGINEDITDRKQAETALAEQALHTQAILDNMVDGIITIDRVGIIGSFNPAAERIFGYTAAEVVGRNVSMLMPNPHRDAHDGYLRNYQATGVARIIGIGREVEGQRRDGSLFPMDLAISEVTRQGQPMYVGMVRDITERKRMERMKSEFVSTVSHELRTPLTSISGALGLVAGGALGALPEQAQQMIAIAQKNSQRLTHLINDLLDMEKIAAGKLHFEMRPQSLMPLIDQALEANRPYGAERRVSLVLKGDANAAEVRVDSQRLMQVLANLLSNAIKFSPEGGTVEVRTSLHGERVRVDVADNGPGIPAEFRERIFQKFAQADSSDTRQKGGTGLGLAITRELVERMGGRIGFDSVEGEGANFWIDLPLWHAVAAGSAPVGDVDAPRILVVEDEPDVAQVLGLMLTRVGYQVDIVGTGVEALRALQQMPMPYAAVSLDLMLPDISGLEIIRQVRQRPETTDLPIVVVSAKMEEGRLAINGDFSGIDWLAKPIDENRLLTVINGMVSTIGTPHPRVLHVEDDADLHKVIRAMVGGRFEFDLATTLSEARARVMLERFDVVILDLNLPDGSGWDLLPDIRQRQPDARVVILSGTDTTAEETRKVEAVLLKSHVSPRELLDALSTRIQSSKPKGGRA